MNITATSDNRKLQAHLKEITKKVAPGAQASALNSSAGYIKREAVKIAAKSTGAPAKVLRKRIAVPKSKKAKLRSLKAVVFGGMWKLPVSKMKPAPRKLANGRVKYKAMAGDSVKPQAFIGRTTNGGTRVFERKSDSRLPISSITADIGPHVKRAVQGFGGGKAAQDYYRKRLFSQMDRRIRGALIRMGVTVK